jgi:hypothetical protein
MATALIVKIITAILGLAMDVFDIIEKSGVKVDADQVLKDAAARLKSRHEDLAGVKKDVLDILDGTKPIGAHATVAIDGSLIPEGQTPITVMVDSATAATIKREDITGLQVVTSRTAAVDRLGEIHGAGEVKTAVVPVSTIPFR